MAPWQGSLRNDGSLVCCCQAVRCQHACQKHKAVNSYAVSWQRYAAEARRQSGSLLLTWHTAPRVRRPDKVHRPALHHLRMLGVNRCYQSSSDTPAHDNGRAGSAFVSLQSSASQGSNVTKIQGDSARGGARMQLAVVDCWQLAKARRLASSTHAAAARLMRGCGCAHDAASSPSEPAQCVCASATMSNGLSDCNQ